MNESTWLPFALACSLVYAFYGAVLKKIILKLNFFITTQAVILTAAVIFTIASFFTDFPSVERDFYLPFVCATLLNVIAVTLHNKALSISPLSLTVPFLSFTPAFLFITEFILFGKMPSTAGIAGVILITAGGYTINITDLKKGVLVPFKAIWRERGSFLMFIVAFIWSATAALDKKCVLASSPFFYLWIQTIALSIIFTPLAFIFFRDFKNFHSSLPLILLGGILLFIMLLSQMIAIQTVFVSFVISIKRAGVILSVVFGCVFFHEKHFLPRFTGTVLMSAGVALILSF